MGPTAAPKRRGGIGLYHLAWQVDTIDELAAARDTLRDAGAYTGESSHGATKSVYGADPDGNEFEIMWMLPREDWGVYESSAPIDHLDLDGRGRPLDRRAHRRAGRRRPGLPVTGLLPVTVAQAGSADPAAPLVVLLHGRGSSERDIIGPAGHLPGGPA